MKVRFLLDENLSPRLKLAIFRLNPEIDILRVGDLGAPTSGTLNPDVLIYLEKAQRILLTDIVIRFLNYNFGLERQEAIGKRQ